MKILRICQQTFQHVGMCSVCGWCMDAKAPTLEYLCSGTFELDQKMAGNGRFSSFHASIISRRYVLCFHSLDYLQTMMIGVLINGLPISILMYGGTLKKIAYVQFHAGLSVTPAFWSESILRSEVNDARDRMVCFWKCFGNDLVHRRPVMFEIFRIKLNVILSCICWFVSKLLILIYEVSRCLERCSGLLPSSSGRRPQRLPWTDGRERWFPNSSDDRHRLRRFAEMLLQVTYFGNQNI